MKPGYGIRTPLPEIKTTSGCRFAAWLFLALGVSVGLTGCFGFLKPVPSLARHFVLTPAASVETSPASSGPLAVGVGPVKLPAYLFNSSLAVRKGANEIDYSQDALWAERLDTGIQRVLAANLATQFHTDKIRLSSWRSEDVSAEVYVAIEQFDVDAEGKGVLMARWRILAPGGETLLRSGGSSLQRPGPPPDKDPSGAVTTLSELVGDLGKQLAQALTDTSSKR